MTEIRSSVKRGIWRGPILHALYDILFFIVLAVAAPYLIVRVATSPRYRAGLCQRLGIGRIPRPERPVIWVHGVSVGEIRTARPLVERLERAYPNMEVVISSTTLGGQEVARGIFPNRTIVYYPLDFGPVVARFLRILEPKLIVLVELELWPNLLYRANRSGVPVVVVNGRVTERSWRGYQRLGPLCPQMDRVAYFSVQNEVYRARLSDLGVPDDRISITGNLKYDALRLLEELEDGGDKGRRDRRRELGIDQAAPVLVCGSTHDNEEEILFRVFRKLRRRIPSLRLVLVPRKVERAQEIVRVLSRSEKSKSEKEDPIDRITALRSGAVKPTARTVWILDTLGELAGFYAISDLVFVGGTLVPHGGQNMMEPAGLGRPVLFGPHVDNFLDDVALLLGQDAAIQVKDSKELEVACERLLKDGASARLIGERARSVVSSARGATERNFEIIDQLITHRANV